MAGMFSLRKHPLRRVAPLIGKAALGERGRGINEFFQASTVAAQLNTQVQVETTWRAQTARGLVVLAAEQQAQERAAKRSAPEAQLASRGGEVATIVAAVELSLRDYARHSDRQLQQLVKICAGLVIGDPLVKVCNQFEGTLRSFGKSSETEITEFLALLQLVAPSKRGAVTTSMSRSSSSTTKRTRGMSGARRTHLLATRQFTHTWHSARCAGPDLHAR